MANAGWNHFLQRQLVSFELNEGWRVRRDYTDRRSLLFGSLGINDCGSSKEFLNSKKALGERVPMPFFTIIYRGG